MKGKFIKSPVCIWFGAIIFLTCIGLLIGSCFWCKGAFASNNIADGMFSIMAILFFLFVGFFAALMCLTIFSKLELDNIKITGYIVFYGRFSIDYSEITFVTRHNYLIRLYLKNGKTIDISALENSYKTYVYIFSRIKPQKDGENLMKIATTNNKRRKNAIVGVISLIVLMFVNIFVCVILTGEKDFADFTTRDTKIFVIFSITEILVFVMMFFLVFLSNIFYRKSIHSMRMLCYYTAIKLKDKGIEKIEQIVEVKYFVDYSKRLVVIKAEDESYFYFDAFFFNEHRPNSSYWETITELIPYNNESLESMLNDDFIRLITA